MKSRKLNVFAAGLLALSGLALPASAQTVIRILGSNGDRTATQTAISHLLDAGWKYRGINGATDSTGTQSTATNSNFGTWNGTYGGAPVIIKASFAGALAGIAAVAGGQPAFRFPVTDGTGSGTIPNGLTSTNTADYELAKADFGFSTNFQSTSPFNGVYQGVTYSPVTEEVVGVTPLGFYAGPGFPGSPSSDRPSYVPNITNQLAFQLYSQGVLPLSAFTGDYTTVNPGETAGNGTGDKNKLVFALGRNTDAGQRFSAHLEVGLGTNTQVRQWFPTVSGTVNPTGAVVSGGTVSSQQLWPVNQQAGTFPVLLGAGGYNSGSLLAQNISAALSSDAYKVKYTDADVPGDSFLYPKATAGYYLGYVAVADGEKGVVGAGVPVPGVRLTFNGVPLSTANVKNGTYTAWLYNRIIKPQSGLSGTPLAFANALRDQIKNTSDATAGGGFADDATVFVQRFTDGGAVVPK